MEKTVTDARENRDIGAWFEQSDIPNTLEDKVLTALERAGVNEDVSTLLGHCQRNAVAVRDEFRNIGFDAVTVKGWVVDMQNHIIPRSMGEAQADGVVHWWAEVELQGAWYTVDLAANDRDHWGDLYFSKTRPGTYRPCEIDPDEMGAVRDEYDLQPPEGIFDEAL